MPEGDTIHRTADRLRPALEGRALVDLRVPRTVGRRPAVGTRIDAVDASGKHLVIRFADGTRLRTHLRMSGSWHLYRTGERWQRAAHLARAVVEVDGWVAVCFSAPVVELEHDDRATAHLGPDLCAADPDVDAAVARFDDCAEPSDEIGALLLDQRIAAGVGNVYRSEVLFACGVDPMRKLSTIDGDLRHKLLATAAKQLRANLAAGPRTTVPEGLAVYRRAGRACRRCGTPITRARQGPQARSVYWCPSCQT